MGTSQDAGCSLQPTSWPSPGPLEALRRPSVGPSEKPLVWPGPSQSHLGPPHMLTRHGEH
eukprot:7342979-Pyramimonas_sp.AAC.1